MRLMGQRDRSNSLSRQLSRVITYCCTIAVIIQGIVMVAMIIYQYVDKEREDILYLLENNNAKMQSRIEYVEEIVLNIRHNPGLIPFLKGQSYNIDHVNEQLSNTVNIFSERNLVNGSTPFIEKVYLYNNGGKSTSLAYYPFTLTQYRLYNEEYKSLYEAFLDSGDDFYYRVSDDSIDLCIHLYDDNMQKMGGCIIVLYKDGIEENYNDVEKTGNYLWKIMGEEGVIIEKNNLISGNKEFLLENAIFTDFGLKLYAAVSEKVFLQSIWSTIITIIITSTFLVCFLAYCGYLVSCHYVRPLKTVAEKIKQVGKGEFHTKLGEYEAEELSNISETFNEMTAYINRLVKEVYETQLMAQQAQIQYLQAQINPHFMFNVLSMIEMKAAINGDKEVQKMIYKLSRLYQGKIFRKNEYMIFLEEEMEITDFYLSLQNSRFGEKITYSIKYEGDKTTYENIKVPRLCIEPIVENAVCHGLEPKEGNGHISIEIKKELDILKIVITDDGVGFVAEEMDRYYEKASEDREASSLSGKRKHTHVGLWNTNNVIHNLFGEDYGLTIDSTPGVGTKVEVRLPVVMDKGV